MTSPNRQPGFQQLPDHTPQEVLDATTYCSPAPRGSLDDGYVGTGVRYDLMRPDEPDRSWKLPDLPPVEPTNEALSDG